VRINLHDLLLREGTDRFHGLGWYGANKLFAGQNINGPVLYGYAGGALGTAGSGTNWTLRWYDNGNVSVRGTLNQGSDRDAKAAFGDVDARDVLEKVAALPLQTWRYRSESDGVRHIGPMAQDFHAAFGVGPDDKHITTVDADGVALAAIQGLNSKVEVRSAETEEKVRWLQAENRELKARLERLEQLIQQLGK
jgi:hypothetical protein